MESRSCSLTRVASIDASAAPVVFQKDANPTKPNRMLAIPHALHHTLNEMNAEERKVYWTAAIERAHALWGDAWGIAVNSEERRSQCQIHAHIGKLLEDADHSGGVLVDDAAQIPVPDNGGGILIRPEAGKFRVYPGESAPETNLMR